MILRKLNILFVDDQMDLARVIGDYLNNTYQHVTTVVPTAERAKKEIQKNRFDVIFVDYRLPGASGLELLQWMQEEKIDSPVIMISGHGHEAIAVEAMKRGAYDYLNKTDIKMDLLPIVINKAVERYVLRRSQEELTAERALREKNAVAIQVFKDTIRTFVDRIRNDLTNIQLRTKIHQKQRQMKRSPETVELDIRQMVGQIEYSAAAIDTTVSALERLYQSLSTLNELDKKALDIKAELESSLKQMEAALSSRPSGQEMRQPVAPRV